jgi:hypothetical protein
MTFVSARNRKGFFSETDNREKGRAALRLQPQERASRFEDRRLPLPVLPDQKIESGGEVRPERFEAAEISQLKISEHGNSSN